MFVGTEVEITYAVKSILLIAMSIDPECDLQWSSREYLDYSYEKYGSVGRVSYEQDTNSFDEDINALNGNLG